MWGYQMVRREWELEGKCVSIALLLMIEVYGKVCSIYKISILLCATNL
jgi:hypothetical protein